MFHFMTHAFFKALLFLGAGVVIQALHEEQDIFRMGGLRRELPLVFWTFLVGGASLAGFPLVTAGFYSKDLILAQVWSSGTAGHWFSRLLTVIATLGLTVATVYALSLIQRAFYGPNIGGWKFPDLSVRDMAIMTAMIVTIVWLGLYPQPVLGTAGPALRGLQRYATSSFVATVSKGAMFALLLRYFAQANAYGYGSLTLALSVIAVASMLAGNLLALMQDNVKRILAYSSIAHLGYLLVAFLAAGPMAEYTCELMKREEAAEGTVAFHFEKPHDFHFRPGQYADLTLVNPPETDAEGNTRTFSIASPPCEGDLVFVARMRDTAFMDLFRELATIRPGIHFIPTTTSMAKSRWKWIRTTSGARNSAGTELAISPLLGSWTRRMTLQARPSAALYVARARRVRTGCACGNEGRVP